MCARVCVFNHCSEMRATVIQYVSHLAKTCPLRDTSGDLPGERLSWNMHKISVNNPLSFTLSHTFTRDGNKIVLFTLSATR